MRLMSVLVCSAFVLAACGSQSPPSAKIESGRPAPSTASASPSVTPPPGSPDCPASTPDEGIPSSFVEGAPERSSTGKGMVVVGELVDGLDCSPLAGVKVHVWHEGPKGGYRDKYRSVLFTDAAGRFRYSGPSMRKSEEADPHVHFLVELPSGPFPFTTGVGLFERGRTQKANIVVVLPASEAEEPAL